MPSAHGSKAVAKAFDMHRKIAVSLIIALILMGSAFAQQNSDKFYQFTPYYAKDLIYADPEFDVYSPNFPTEENERVKFCNAVKGWESQKVVNAIVVLKKPPEYSVTKDWLWNTFRPKIIRNVVSEHCPGTINFQATFFIEGIGFRADPFINSEYDMIYPLVFEIDKTIMPRLEISRTGYTDIFFHDKGPNGESVERAASDYFYPQGFMVNNFYIPENFPGGLDGELGELLLWRGKKNVSYETFEIARWANSKAASFSFNKKIESLKRGVARAAQDREREKRNAANWSLFLMAIADENQPDYCEASKDDWEKPLACAGYRAD